MCIASVVLVCLAAPIIEAFDQWDHTYQSGTDSEVNAVVVALCFGIAFVAIRATANIRLMSQQVSRPVVQASSPPLIRYVAVAEAIPTAGPPAQLRC